MPKASERRWLAPIIAAMAFGAALSACSTGPKSGLRISLEFANGRSATVHSSLPVKVYVTDNNGASISGTVVTWTVIDRTGATVATKSTTDATGAAMGTWTLDTIAGLDSMTASIPSGSSVTITATGVAGPVSAFTKISGDNQFTAVALGANTLAPDPLVVAVTDRYGNGIAGAPIEWTSACNFRFNGGTPTGTYTGAATDASGRSEAALVFASPKGICAIQVTTTVLSTVLTFHMSAT